MLNPVGGSTFRKSVNITDFTAAGGRGDGNTVNRLVKSDIFVHEAIFTALNSIAVIGKLPF